MTVKTAPQAVLRYIYALMATDTGEAIWVGATTQPQRRLQNHRREQWGKEVQARGSTIALVVLEKCVDNLWVEAEQDWIRRLRVAGAPLHNRAIGGPGALGHKHTDTARAKMSKAHTGKTLSIEHRANLSKSHKGMVLGPQSPAHIAALSAARRGRKLTAEHRAKIAEANRNRSIESRARTAESMRGKRASPETRAKMSVNMRAAKQRKREGYDSDS